MYTKTKDGDVREGCNDTTEAELARARQYQEMAQNIHIFMSGLSTGNHLDIIDHGDGWFPGKLPKELLDY